MALGHNVWTIRPSVPMGKIIKAEWRPYMCQLTVTVLVQTMSCQLIDAEALSEPMLS